MVNRYNEVYVKNDAESTFKEINPEFVYLTIPSDWVCIYHRLLVAVADLGKNIIDDCTATCKGSGKNILNCWNLFQSALACRSIGKNKEAEFFINYIDKQIESLYRGVNKDKFNGTNYFPISEDGYLKALCSCKDNNIKFEVDFKTGELYQKYLDNKQNGQVFTIEENNLIVSDNDKL